MFKNKSSGKILFIMLLFIFISATATAQSITVDSTQNEVQSGEELSIANYTIENNQDQDIEFEGITVTGAETNTWGFESQPESSTITGNGSHSVELYAEIPENFSPNTYNSTVNFNFDNQTAETMQLETTVVEDRSWIIENQDFQENISVGEDGTLGQFQLLNEGNQRSDIDVEIQGSLEEYIGITETVNLFPSISNSQTVTYQVPSDTEFGDYEATIILQTQQTGQTEQIDIETRFIDEIKPEIHNTSINSFQATEEETFEVEVTDNIGVENVYADIIYETTVTEQENNETVEVTENQTLETVEFEPVENTDLWKGEMENNREIGNYFVEGVVEDGSGNQAAFTDQINISQLEALQTKDSVEIPEYRHGNEATAKIAELSKDTKVEVTLEGFDNEINTWGQIAVKYNDNRNHFSGEGDTITVEEASDLEIFVYSDEVSRFSGRISYKPVDEHVNVSDTQFSGEYLNFTMPSDETFTMYGVHYNCEGNPSEVAEEAGWNCEAEIDASDINPDQNLEEDMQLIVPSEAKREQEDIWQSRIETAENDAASSTFWRNVMMLMLLMTIGYTTYYTKYYPKHYSLHLESSESAVERINLIETIKQKTPSIKG